MAIVNPSSLYSAGNVALDSTPYVRMAEQQKAKQTAINEATYRHYSELPDKLNMAGVRQQDLQDPNGSGGINNDLVGVRSFWDDNSKDIMRGGRAQQQYAKMIQSVQQRIEGSKQAGKLQLEIGKSFFDGKHDRDEDDIKIDHALDQSIYNDGYYKDKVTKTTYGLNDYSSATPAYTSQKQIQFDKAVMGDIEPKRDTGNPVIDDKTFQVGYSTKYATKDIDAAATNAARLSSLDKTIKAANKKLLLDPEQVKNASNGLSYLAEGLVVPSTPEQMAAGLTAYNMMHYKGQDLVKDISQYNKAKVEAQLRNFAFRSEQTRIKEAGKDRRAPKNTVELPNPYKTLVDNAVAIKTPKFTPASASNPLGQQEMETEYFAPKELLTAAEQGYMTDLPGGQKNSYVERGGKLGLLLKDGELYGSNGKIDRKVVDANVSRTVGGVLKQVKTGKVTFGDKGTAPTKGFSLNASDRKKHN